MHYLLHWAPRRLLAHQALWTSAAGSKRGRQWPLRLLCVVAPLAWGKQPLVALLCAAAEAKNFAALQMLRYHPGVRDISHWFAFDTRRVALAAARAGDGLEVLAACQQLITASAAAPSAPGTKRQQQAFTAAFVHHCVALGHVGATTELLRGLHSSPQQWTRLLFRACQLGDFDMLHVLHAQEPRCAQFYNLRTCVLLIQQRLGCPAPQSKRLCLLWRRFVPWVIRQDRVVVLLEELMRSETPPFTQPWVRALCRTSRLRTGRDTGWATLCAMCAGLDGEESTAAKAMLRGTRGVQRRRDVDRAVLGAAPPAAPHGSHQRRQTTQWQNHRANRRDKAAGPGEGGMKGRPKRKEAKRASAP